VWQRLTANLTNGILTGYKIKYAPEHAPTNTASELFVENDADLKDSSYSKRASCVVLLVYFLLEQF
jgi:hypothetical protein